MQKVRCYECKKTYDYDEDPFCPQCGAFNQPPKASRINVRGEVERVDGLNERGHSHSFVHAELHKEDAERRRSGLEQTIRSVPIYSKPAARKKGSEKQAAGSLLRVIQIVIFVLVLVNILRAFAYTLLF